MVGVMHSTYFGIQSGTAEEDAGALDRMLLLHMLNLRRPDGWPVIGAEQFIEDLLDGSVASDPLMDRAALQDFLNGGSIAHGTTLLLGCHISFAYRMLVGAIPLTASIAWPTTATDHPDWLWAKPSKQWAHPEVPVYSNGRHYCGPLPTFRYADPFTPPRLQTTTQSQQLVHAGPGI